jgi:g-D-glutamyl-meso-diaminopimelate peptidase
LGGGDIENRSIVRTDMPYGYETMMEDIRRLMEEHPTLELHIIGLSALGRPIPALKLGAGTKEIHYNGSFHANEWITTLALMKFIEDYMAAVSNRSAWHGYSAEELFRDTSLWIVPMVNPDGVELVHRGKEEGRESFEQWKANARGVDLNDQFPAGWEIEKERRSPKGPGPRDYVGEAPLSEPEAEVMARFTRAKDFRWVIAFHTQGQEIYWNYRGFEPAESEAMAGRLGEVSGFAPIRLTDSDAGYKDWFIQEFRRPGFTVELGDGVNPLPLSQFPELYEKASIIMLEGLCLDRSL